MNITEFLETARDAIGVQRVFGEPVPRVRLEARRGRAVRVPDAPR